MPAAPLPLRDGLDPTRVRMPDKATGVTVLEHLRARFPQDAARLTEKVAGGEVVDAAGVPIDSTTVAKPRSDIYLYRDPPVEPTVPFSLDVLHQDENLLVVDKPHFLATTPRGAYVARSALVLLRRRFDLPELSPAHRLDRLTAGVLVFTVRQQARRPYQELFTQRAITKQYDAIAPLAQDMDFPLTVRSRIIKERGVLQAREVPGEPNADTFVELVDTLGTHGLYRLHPRTGKTHQLRVHMCSLGIPIVGDNFYPAFRNVADDDYSDPLRLLARSIEFVDPLSGLVRRFESDRSLEPPAMQQIRP
ncbi:MULTISPECIES: pseudouridine synthase [unclassified Rhodococcus (in: high G+C Gram-positive bacteria)]|uniref:pseudouridine synthase n=1 Tax=unclassified Rhodococcus (in: high G+C Gram-positive bacteria) TaxID=192944 RepID=UPI000B9B3078|nr:MULTISPECIES: pseudouridine synthase [unclassified Rhodococcus (in: high G+C Gram-positive bacteria)]OZE37110.1 pseudouridine synthase [Rhodococcus sp. 05-2254-4]OZE44832.1 pseudouridine synthase [Rhodococcus sp. 05-2254-3]OZE45236.1 pseudouridine synthase [Rhodococcus sp. 05-2254-2]